MKTITLALVMLAASTVHAAPSKPPQAAPEGVKTAVCNDGKTYYSPTGEHRGACSGHHGVASWSDNSPVRSKGGAKTSYR